MLKIVLRDSLVYGLASILSKGLVIFLLPLYTRVLSPEEYGAYDLIITLGVLVNLTVPLEISQGLARNWSESLATGSRKSLASTSLWFTVVVYVVFLILGLIAAPNLNELILHDGTYIDSFRLGICFIALNGIFYLLLNQFRWELRSKDYALVSVLYALLTLLLALFFCQYFDLKLFGVLLAQFLAALIAIFCSLWLLRQTFGWQFDERQLIVMLRFSAPLVPAGLAVFISLYFNRFALNHYGSLQDVGLFGVGSRIASLAAILILGIQAALMPMVYQHHRDPQTPGEIARIFGWFSGVALIGCLFLGVFSQELLMLFATQKFMGGAELVIVLAPSLLISQMYIFAPGIAIAKKTHWQLWVTLFSAVVSISSNWVLVPLWGIWGATLSALLSSLVFFLTWLYLSQRLYWIPYNWVGLRWATLVFVVCGSVSILIGKQELDFIHLLLIKPIIVMILMYSVIACGLIPLRDIHALWIVIKKRLIGWGFIK